jgi:hypothetical protein
LIPLGVVLSALWMSKGAAQEEGREGLVYLRYILGFFVVVLFISLVFDYVIIDTLSNYEENGMNDQENAMLSYLTNGLENAIVILALLIGINPKK